MNFRVCINDMDMGKDEVYHLVYPQDADIRQNKISILGPFGRAVTVYIERT
jgi:transcription elongation GreA/GreB family factor